MKYRGQCTKKIIVLIKNKTSLVLYMYICFAIGKVSLIRLIKGNKHILLFYFPANNAEIHDYITKDKNDKICVEETYSTLKENRNRNVPIIKLEFALVAINGKRYLHEKCIYVWKRSFHRLRKCLIPTTKRLHVKHKSSRNIHYSYPYTIFSLLVHSIYDFLKYIYSKWHHLNINYHGFRLIS